MIERIVRTLPAIVWMGFIFAMSSREQFPQPFGLSTVLLSFAAHMMLYGVLAVLLLVAIASDGSTSRSTALGAIVAAALYGVSDEFHQSFVPGRDASVIDIIVNTLGATIAVSAWVRARSVLTAVNTR